MLSFARALCPFPTVGPDGDLQDGYLIGQPRKCKKCRSKGRTACLSDLRKACQECGEACHHFECPKRMSIYQIQFQWGSVICNGLLDARLNRSCPPAVRKANKSQRITLEQISKWQSAFLRSVETVEQLVDTRVVEAIQGLHDVKTAVSIVTRNAEAIVQTLEGATDDERIETADPPLKGLLKSVELLRTRLAMSSIVANPEAASYGRTHPTPIYKMFHRMVKLFEEQANARRVTVRMAGSSFNQPPARDSLDTLALVLIDNAVKYSPAAAEVTVGVEDVGDAVEVCIQNRGPIVPEADRPRIFDRGYRTIAAARTASSGSGLGLYIAATVAKAHGFEIRYESEESPLQPGIGVNKFRFRIGEPCIDKSSA